MGLVGGDGGEEPPTHCDPSFKSGMCDLPSVDLMESFIDEIGVTTPSDKEAE